MIIKAAAKYNMCYWWSSAPGTRIFFFFASVDNSKTSDRFMSATNFNLIHTRSQFLQHMT